MRILIVWITAFILIFFVSISWYISQPIVLGVSRALNASYYEDPNGRNIALAIEYASYAWGGVFIIFILLWAIVSSKKYDAESEMYG